MYSLRKEFLFLHTYSNQSRFCLTYIISNNFSNDQGTSTSDLNVVVVGNPVANCQAGNNQVVTTKYLAAMDIEETWSTDLTLGLAISGLNIGGTSGWSKSRTIKASQEVELIVVPGQMVRSDSCHMHHYQILSLGSTRGQCKLQKDDW